MNDPVAIRQFWAETGNPRDNRVEMSAAGVTVDFASRLTSSEARWLGCRLMRAAMLADDVDPTARSLSEEMSALLVHGDRLVDDETWAMNMAVNARFGPPLKPHEVQEARQRIKELRIAKAETAEAVQA